MAISELVQNIKISKRTTVDAQLAEQLRTIYLDSFPPSQRVPVEEIVRDIGNGRQWLFAAMIGESLTGFAVGLPLLETDMHLLEYMAVARTARDRGIGGTLLQAIVEHLKLSASASEIILEVEPDEYGSDKDRNLRARRIQFYERNGACRVKCAPRYCIPDLAGDGIVHMTLMCLPVLKSAESPCGDRLKNCIRAIYCQSYGRPPDDPLISYVLNQLIC